MKKEERKLSFDVEMNILNDVVTEDNPLHCFFDVSFREFYEDGDLKRVRLKKLEKFDYYFLKNYFETEKEFKKTKKFCFWKPDFWIVVSMIENESCVLLEEPYSFLFRYDCLAQDFDEEDELSVSFSEREDFFKEVCENEK